MAEPRDVARETWLMLSALKKHDSTATMATCLHWLEHHEAGTPDVPLFLERIRDDARFWALCAHSFELEAYAAACISEMDDAAMLDKQVRRLAGQAFRLMDPVTKEKFKEWVAQQ